MEGVFAGLFRAVWPRFKASIEAQVEALKTAGGSASMPSGILRSTVASAWWRSPAAGSYARLVR